MMTELIKQENLDESKNSKIRNNKLTKNDINQELK